MKPLAPVSNTTRMVLGLAFFVLFFAAWAFATLGGYVSKTFLADPLTMFADGRQLITLYESAVRITPCEVCGPIDDVLALAGQRTTRDFTPEARAKYVRESG